jgi:hypothetical protein
MKKYVLQKLKLQRIRYRLEKSINMAGFGFHQTFVKVGTRNIAQKKSYISIQLPV